MTEHKLVQELGPGDRFILGGRVNVPLRMQIGPRYDEQGNQTPPLLYVTCEEIIGEKMVPNLEGTVETEPIHRTYAVAWDFPVTLEASDEPEDPS